MNKQTQNNTPAHPTFQSLESEPDRIARLRLLLGNDAILLPVAKKTKKPIIKEWPELTASVMEDEQYLADLQNKNTGVLLGANSGHLVSIDCDTDEAATQMLEANPKLAETLRTRGARGCNYWLRIPDGDYPATKKIQDTDGEDIGEFRATGGQTVISGLHPDGCEYKILVSAPPISLSFADIVWPENWLVPWCTDLFDQLVEREGDPVAISNQGAVQLNRSFFASLLATEEMLRFDTGTCKFRQYEPETGVWVTRREEWINEKISQLLKRSASELGCKRLETLRTMSVISDVRTQVRNKTAAEFKRSQQGILHVKNGMLGLGMNGGLALMEFSPDYLSTHQLSVNFDPEAQCPTFLNQLLRPTLSEDDLTLLQKLAGMILVERKNIAQKIVLLDGSAGAGKSIFCEVVEMMLGLDHCAELRTNHLADRFETASFLAKSLLCGKDVNGNFLSHEGASELKSLTGGGQKEAEIKGEPQKVKYDATFNVLISCNGRLKIRLDGDNDAWERRLLIIHYPVPMARMPQPGCAEWLFEKEGGGILNWAIVGYYRLWEDIKNAGTIQISTAQKNHIVDLIEGSDSVTSFVLASLTISKGSDLTTDELAKAYAFYCRGRNWQPLTDLQFRRSLEAAITKRFGISKSHNISRGASIHNGFTGITLAKEAHHVA